MVIPVMTLEGGGGAERGFVGGSDDLQRTQRWRLRTHLEQAEKFDYQRCKRLSNQRDVFPRPENPSSPCVPECV